MTNEEKTELIKKLLTGTKSKKLKWTLIEDSIYQLNFQNSALVLDDYRNSRRPPEAQFVIRIFNSNGAVVEVISVKDLEEAGIRAGNALSLIVDEIRDQAFGIKDTIKDIFDNLN
jgi:hypothetical protein